MSIELSIVVPMYNESDRLEDGVQTILLYAKNRKEKTEVLLVDDGSQDDTADKAAALLDKLLPETGTLLRLNPNQGKGAAVRTGMRKAKGRVRLFADADNATPIEEVERLLPFIRSDRDIVIGSRALKDSQIEVPQPWWRQTMGRTFNLLPRLVLGLPFKDTQCGFKLFGQTAAEICFSRQRLERFAFDVELLWIARKKQLCVREIPVRWIDSPQSRVHPIFDSLRMARDVFKVRWQHRKPR